MHVGKLATHTARADEQRRVSYVPVRKAYLFTASSEGLAQPLFGEMRRNETKGFICLTV